MKLNKDVQNILTQIVHWAKSQEDIKGIALVGSYARGTADKDSDIDLVMLAKNHKNYINELSWLNQFGNVEQIQKQHTNRTTYLHVKYNNSYEIEFIIATSAWAKMPPDRDTIKIVQDGIQILHDPYYLFQKIKNFIMQEIPEDKLQHILKSS